MIATKPILISTAGKLRDANSGRAGGGFQVRRVGRALRLLFELFRAAMGKAVWSLSLSQDLRHKGRARWVRITCRRLLRCLNVKIRLHGPIPGRGLLIANHLGYLDILVLGSLTPVRFISKSEVRSWPVIGSCARWAGTIFIDRSRRADVHRVNTEIRQALEEEGLVGLFPEGTSSDGTTVLSFKSSLLQSAAEGAHSLALAHLSYRLEDGDVTEEVCYWKDMTLGPHLWNLLGKRQIEADVRLEIPPPPRGDRKAMALQLRDALVAMAEHAPTRQEEEAL